MTWVLCMTTDCGILIFFFASCLCSNAFSWSGIQVFYAWDCVVDCVVNCVVDCVVDCIVDCVVECNVFLLKSGNFRDLFLTFALRIVYSIDSAETSSKAWNAMWLHELIRHLSWITFAEWEICDFFFFLCPALLLVQI